MTRGGFPEENPDNKPRRTPLDPWIQEKVSSSGNMPLTRSLLEAYQVRKIREVFSYAREMSPFYRGLLSGFPIPAGLDDFSCLPFTYSRDVREKGLAMLCVSQDEIARAVTLSTSGTTGDAKRLFFTEGDLELTTDFFAHGMRTLVEPGETVIIFLPCQRPHSVGDLLAKALRRIGVNPVGHGPISDLKAARDEILKYPAASLVGIPSQILSVARADVTHTIPRGWVGNVLLSTDYVPKAIIRALENLWGCNVFSHYGMTETGLGGGVECEARAGYHMREADLYFEVVDPFTGEHLEEGQYGEIVVTTLTRRGMPLIRYRTGDLAGFRTDPCPCGTVLTRMNPVKGRIGDEVNLGEGLSLRIPDLDEALFAIDGVLNYTAEITGTSDKAQLHLCFFAVEAEERIAQEVPKALRANREVRQALDCGTLTLGAITWASGDWFTTGVKKRRITDTR
jgi:phenylacetate-CoA ligase